MLFPVIMWWQHGTPSPTEAQSGSNNRYNLFSIAICVAMLAFFVAVVSVGFGMRLLTRATTQMRSQQAPRAHDDDVERIQYRQ